MTNGRYQVNPEENQWQKKEEKKREETPKQEKKVIQTAESPFMKTSKKMLSEDDYDLYGNIIDSSKKKYL